MTDERLRRSTVDGRDSDTGEYRDPARDRLCSILIYGVPCVAAAVSAAVVVLFETNQSPPLLRAYSSSIVCGNAVLAVTGTVIGVAMLPVAPLVGVVRLVRATAAAAGLCLLFYFVSVLLVGMLGVALFDAARLT